MSYIFKTVLHGERVVRGKKHPGSSLSPVRLHTANTESCRFSRARARARETGLFLARASAREKLKNKIMSFYNTLVINILHFDI